MRQSLLRRSLPEATVTDDIIADLKDQSATLRELHIDRAYLASNLVKHRAEVARG